MDTAQHDDVGVGLTGLLRQPQGVTRIVRDAMVDLGRLIVVGEENRVALHFELVDEGDVGRVYRPLRFRNDVLDALVDRRRRRGDLGRICGNLRHNHLYLCS